MDGPKKVLLVDDDEDQLFIISTFLEKAGYAVVSAFGPEQAIARAKGEKFDVMITDFSMPVMNGSELISEVKSLPGYEKCPTIIFAASEEVVKEKSFERSRPDCFITKQNVKESLTSALRNLLG